MLTQAKLERHIRRVGDAFFDQFRQNASHDLSRARLNEYYQPQCEGCSEICKLLRWGEVQRRRDTAYRGCSLAHLIHHSYRELDFCARVSRCDTCRTIRRAFLLAQITVLDAVRLECPDNQRPVYAVLNLSPSGDTLSLAIGSPDKPMFSATIRLDDKPRLLPRDLTKGGAMMRPDLTELHRIIHDCHHNHACSSRHRWSRRNPTWLLQILPNHQVRLVEGPPSPVQYVVLSYSWGDPATMPAAEWARIKGAGTKTKDGRPVAERLNPFPVWDLPETMQDAIALSASLGFYYIWVDNVCIPKGTSWNAEASLMHEVYGNAAFTLIASSSTKATDHLLHDRLAWMHRSKACKLRGRWLHNTLMPLDQVRLKSPVSQRAWTLQEERLSPRILYWTGQRWYWACPERQVAELCELGCASPATGDDDGATTRSSPQRFLELCHTGDQHQLHEEWLDIVEAYTPRHLVEPRDRFLAISGLAVRFYNATAGNGGGVSFPEEYLAGLWKDNLARHLSWSVATAVDPRGNLQHIAPSWSWASLPLQVQTRTKHHFTPSEHFRFIAAEYTDGEASGTERAKAVSRRAKENLQNRGQIVEERGRNVKVVEVQGRFRRFIPKDAQQVPWAAVERRRGSSSGCASVFDFAAFPGQPLYARHEADGRILSKDAHCGEVVAQLDYLVQADDADGQPRTCLSTVTYVRAGHEKELMCLELGEMAMLLLVRVQCGRPGEQADVESYRRVGVAVGYGNRKGFFYGCETKRICLA